MSKRTAIILVILFFLGAVFQSVVIIDYYSERLNLGFFGTESETGVYYQSLGDNISEKHSKPYEIIVRFNELSLILDEGESSFGSLWSDARDVINDVFERGFSESSLTWTEACLKPGVTVSMGGYFPIEYIAFMIGSAESEIKDIAIDKFMFVPSENDMTVYIHTKDKVYEKTGLPPYGRFTEDNFLLLTEFLQMYPGYTDSFLKDLFRLNVRDSVMETYIEPDIPVNLDISHHKLPLLLIGLPDIINDYYEAANSIEGPLRDDQLEHSAETIKTELFAKSGNLYETHFDSLGNLFFTNKFNTYEIDRTGWISYKYTPGTTGDEKGGIGEAFINAYETYSTIFSLSSGKSGEFFVSRIRDNGDSYTFSFDYRYDSRVITISNENHAAEITATATRTVEARVLLLDYKKLDDDAQVEIPYIFDFSSNLKHNEIYNLNEVEAYNIYVGYGEFSGNQNLIYPVWVIEKENGEKDVYHLLRGDE